MSEGWVYEAAEATDVEVLTQDADYSEGGYGLGRMGSVRGIGMLASGARSLGISQLVGPLAIVAGALELIMGGYKAFEAVKAAIDARAALEEVAAAAESIAAAVAQNWAGLALAGVAAAAVAGGAMFSEGSFELPAPDISNAAGRDMMGAQLREVAIVGR